MEPVVCQDQRMEVLMAEVGKDLKEELSGDLEEMHGSGVVGACWVEDGEEDAVFPSLGFKYFG
jgi:hypothetical protein